MATYVTTSSADAVIYGTDNIFIGGGKIGDL